METILYWLCAHGMSHEKAMEHAYGNSCLRDLEEEITEGKNDAQLFDINNWNLPALMNTDGDYRRPRIELWVEVTSARALSLHWQPVNWLDPDRAESCDFRRFSSRRHPYEGPDNRLLYLRDFSYLMYRLKDDKDRYLLIAIREHLKAIEHKLAATFDVTCINKLELINASAASLNEFDNKSIEGARIYDVAERDRKLKLAAQAEWEKKELHPMVLTREQLLEALREFRRNQPARVAARLSECSEHAVCAQDVRRWIAGIEKFFGPLKDFADKEPDPEPAKRAPRPR